MIEVTKHRMRRNELRIW